MKQLVQMNLLSDLKDANPSFGRDSVNNPDVVPIVLVLGRTSVGDGNSAFFRWDPTSTAAEDLTYMAVVKSNRTTVGRWVRVFQRNVTVPQGTLVMNGGVKTLYVAAVTDSNGRATINLTYENTPTGTPIFSEVWKNDSRARINASTQNEAVSSYMVQSAEATSFKTTTHGYYKPNAVTLTIGLVYAPIANIGAGTTVLFEVVGI